MVHSERAGMVLPLALAPGASTVSEVELAAPQAGARELVLALVDGTEIARLGVSPPPG